MPGARASMPMGIPTWGLGESAARNGVRSGNAAGSWGEPAVVSTRSDDHRTTKSWSRAAWPPLIGNFTEPV